MSSSRPVSPQSSFGVFALLMTSVMVLSGCGEKVTPIASLPAAVTEAPQAFVPPASKKESKNVQSPPVPRGRGAARMLQQAAANRGR